MELAKSLQAEYGTNKPILLDEIRNTLGGYSPQYVFQLLKTAIDNGELARYDESVYFIPKATMFGDGFLSSDDVVYKKYIQNNKGIYIGWTFLNEIGATRQMPYTIEIATNKESMRVRQISVGGRPFILRKPKCKITADNAKILRIWETAVHFNFYEETTDAVVEFMKSNNISAKELLSFADYYPAQTLKNLTGVLYELA